MLINRIQVTTVFVSDQDKAKDFYVNKLGFQLKFEQQMGPNFRWLEVIPGSGETSIALTLPFPGMESTVGRPTGMLLDTSDIQTAYDTLKASGVNFSEPPTPQPWGAIQAQFSDPDGNGFTLVQRTQ
jgi:catechol 2,3-dioxygenase-like lactoylglutathione lyase family enzyme